MKRFNKKSINYGLKTLTILAFVFIFMPFNMASAQICGDGGCNSVYKTPSSPIYGDINNPYTVAPNPKPIIDSINPSGSNRGSSPKTITVTGSGFVRGSIARVNDSSRFTTFIDDSHVLVGLTSDDMNRNNGFFLTIYNPAPGGGYSNAIYFTINNGANVNNNNNNNTNNGNVYPTANNNGGADSTTYSDTNSNNNGNSASDLASNAIFGANGFLPSGIIQWILFAIFILIIVILIRRISGAKQKYEDAPLKHE